jgi:hypothetical protein
MNTQPKLSDPPPPGHINRPTKFDDSIDFAHKHPTKWVEVPGEHWPNDRERLRNRGLTVRTKRITGTNQVHIWIKFTPET